MAYDGSVYHGWQVQPNGTSVQEVLQNALSTLLRQEIAVTGAGRTDTGVHASYFIAHFDLPDLHIPDPENPDFLFKLNRFLPEDIVVYRIFRVPDEMHARFSAVYRTYHYHISTIKPLFTRNYCHYLYGPLNLEEIGKCCGMILEARDFTSFSKLHTDVKTNNCEVNIARWKEVDNGYLFEIQADRFLRDMVRSLVGTLIEVGQGKLTPEDFREILEARDRTRAGQSAPAAGLFLVDVGYEGLSGKIIND
jgi:tRNA pseudouridine38-40 synthase